MHDGYHQISQNPLPKRVKTDPLIKCSFQLPKKHNYVSTMIENFGVLNSLTPHHSANSIVYNTTMDEDDNKADFLRLLDENPDVVSSLLQIQEDNPGVKFGNLCLIELPESSFN